MGDARGCRGGLRRGLRRCRAAPPLPLVVLPPDGVSTLRYARGPVPPKRRAAALIGFAPFPLPPPRFADGVVSGGQKPARPLRGSAAPPVPAGRRRPWPAAGGVVSRQPPLSSSRSGGASAQPPSPPPSPPASLCAGNQGGGLLQRLWPPRRCGGAPLRPAPPPVLAPGRGYFVSLRRVWGLRRLRAALKVYRTARAAQCKCGVHGFAMNPYVSIYPSTAPYYREARVTVCLGGRLRAKCGIASLTALMRLAVDGN